MKYTVTLLALAALLVGCASPSRVVRSHITISAGTNSVTVEQPKDTVIKHMEYDPATGKLVMTGYSSTANAAALAATEAQIQAQAQAGQAALGIAATAVQAFNALAATYARSQGVPVP